MLVYYFHGNDLPLFLVSVCDGFGYTKGFFQEKIIEIEAKGL